MNVPPFTHRNRDGDEIASSVSVESVLISIEQARHLSNRPIGAMRIYIKPDVARGLAAALIDQADECDAWKTLRLAARVIADGPPMDPTP